MSTKTHRNRCLAGARWLRLRPGLLPCPEGSGFKDTPDFPQVMEPRQVLNPDGSPKLNKWDKPMMDTNASAGRNHRTGVTDTHRRCMTAAAAHFGLAWQLWAKEEIENQCRTGGLARAPAKAPAKAKAAASQYACATKNKTAPSPVAAIQQQVEKELRPFAEAMAFDPEALTKWRLEFRKRSTESSRTTPRLLLTSRARAIRFHADLVMTLIDNVKKGQHSSTPVNANPMT